MTDEIIDSGGRVILSQISSRAFEHPADRTALTALRSLTGFDQLIKAASGLLRERQYRLAYLASSVRVDERQFPAINDLFNEVVGVLDVEERPELYVSANPFAQATTLGVDKPFIDLTSGLVELMDADELRFVLGHELGHAMSGHALYRSLLRHLLNLASLVGWIPIGGLGLRVVIAALREWDRKSELSADRAGLLACQDAEASRRAHMKLAGGAHLPEMDTTAFLSQAEEYENAGTLRDGILKLLNTERSSHPFTVVRAAEIRRWIESGEYDRIIGGDYPRRSEDGSANFADDAKDAAKGYKERFDNSSDQLVGAIRQVTDIAGSAADGLGGWLRRMATGQNGPAGSADSEPADEPEFGQGGPETDDGPDDPFGTGRES
ncbi:MAG TPA: M48 family metallopeptidase [Mycobacteriales bacterium]|jgi:Zn-dependent protease with chaperone function|nr:M48 family metallopeptidase [Mycobacteriales bacterium]